MVKNKTKLKKSNVDEIYPYLVNDKNYSLHSLETESIEEIGKIVSDDYILFHVTELTFEEDSPRKEAFDNVLGALQIPGINFVYLILGDQQGVRFYMGISRDCSRDSKSLLLDVKDVGREILRPSIEGHFRGSKLIEIDDTKVIKQALNKLKYFGQMEGVPALNESEESGSFQGVDRLVDVMTGDTFCISIVASPLCTKDIQKLKESLFNVYDLLTPLAKTTIQKTEGTGKTIGKSESTNISQALGTNTGTNSSNTSGSSKSTTKTKGSSGSSKSSSESGQSGSNTSKTTGTSKGSSITDTKGFSVTKNTSKTNNAGENKSYERGNRRVQDWIQYLDDVIFPRLNYGLSNGLFNTNISIAATKPITLTKLKNTIKSLFLGDADNKAPLRLIELDYQSKQIEALKAFQIPSVNISKMLPIERDFRVALSQSIGNGEDYLSLGNWISTSELSLVAGLPQKEVVGLTLKKEVEFGLNPSNPSAKKDQIKIGSLVRSGNELNIPVCLDRNAINKHIFISGVTGSGKTTTCHKILLSAELPFLVIEPAKTEYRILKNVFSDLLVFTLGTDSIAPFRLNPFEFFPHENITSRVDMIKACIEASFDMEAAIPQIIEAAIYRSYEDYGWNVSDNSNDRFDDPFADGVFAFPTLEDLLRNVEENTKDQGFDERLQKDYIGSIKARLQGLLIGAKGTMLNTKRSVNFNDLITRNVVLELEEIKNGAEKSLIMGFVLINLNEALKAKSQESKKGGVPFKHITLVEEAHRLLARYVPGDSPNKKQGVEVFSDMLAEVRKYGEALIIVDQIPNKLTPEVLKNTNTKIIHKIFAQDDKEAIGSVMALEKDQVDYFSYLETGRAIVSSLGFSKPLQVQIEQVQNLSTTETQDIPKEGIRIAALQYYQKNYQSGIMPGLTCFNDQPSIDAVDQWLRFEQSGSLFKYWLNLFIDTNSSNQMKSAIKRLSAYLKDQCCSYTPRLLANYIVDRFYYNLGMNEDECAERISNILLRLKIEELKLIDPTDKEWLEIRK